MNYGELTSVEPPWRRSAKGFVYCKYWHLPAKLKSVINKEDGNRAVVEQFEYTVKRLNLDFIVFRYPVKEPKPIFKITCNEWYKDEVSELKVLPLEQANKLLGSNDSYNLIGPHAIRIIDNTFFAVIGKRRIHV